MARKKPDWTTCGLASANVATARQMRAAGCKLLAASAMTATVFAFAACDVEDLGTTETESSAIVGGVEANPHFYPAQVVLFANNGDEPSRQTLFCSGTLVRDDVVMTAAHCLQDFGADEQAGVIAVAGEHHIESNDGTEQVAISRRLLIHPDYDPVSLHNDIGLIVLSSKFALTDKVQLVELATTDPTANARVRATGWGETDTEIDSDVLRRVDLDVRDSQVCRDFFDDPDQPSVVRTLGDSAFVGACSGDSGGPLWSRAANGSLLQVGVTSFVDTMCSSLSVFTSVAAYRSWVLGQL